MTSLPKDKFIDLNGHLFHYVDWGGQGRVLILLHGLASNARFWDLAAPHLLSHFRVLAFDQRGHGSSFKPVSDYTFESVAEDIALFISCVAYEKPILVGHSWGGNVAIQIAVDNPSLLAGLICIDGGFIEPSSASGATWEETERTMAPPDFAALRLTWDSFLHRMKNTEVGICWADHLETFLRANFKLQPDGTVLPMLSRERHMLIVRAIWDQNVSSLFEKITCPVLIMPARRLSQTDYPQDYIARKEAQVSRAINQIPRSRVIWLEESIHDVPVQRPQEVASKILSATTDGFFDI